MTDVRRRAVLQALSTAAVGAGAGAPATARPAPHDRTEPRQVPSDDADRGSAATDDHLGGGPVSLREIGEFLDHEHAPLRLYGNGPPFDPGRPGVGSAKKVQYCASDGCTTGSSDAKLYVKFHGKADANAYDVGMANRTPEGLPSDVERAGLSPKGLVESHRWVDPTSGRYTTRRQAQQPPGKGGGVTPPWRSIRNVADRHTEGVTHRCAWLNTQMLGATTSKQRPRAKSLGRMFGAAGYEVVAMGEVDKVEYALDVAREYADRYATASGSVTKKFDRRGLKRGKTHVNVNGALDGQLDVGYGPNRPGSQPLNDSSGLCSLVGKRDGGRHVANIEKTVFDTNPVSAIQVSRQRVEVAADHPGVDAGFELFFTHLSANQDKPIGSRADKRKEQVNQLANAIEQRRQDRPKWPKIAVGDFNVYAHKRFSDAAKADYDYLVDRMDQAGMSDAWVTHGGPVGQTISPDCRPDDDNDGRFSPHCHCDDFELSRLSNEPDGGRLDYVFVEDPRSAHSVNVDLSRIWRIATTRSCHALRSQAVGGAFVVDRDNAGKALSDHAGLGFELVTSPKR